MNLRHPWPLLAIASGLLLTLGLSSSAFASTTGPAANGHYYGGRNGIPVWPATVPTPISMSNQGTRKTTHRVGMSIRPYGRAPTMPRPFKIGSKPDTSTASSRGVMRPPRRTTGLISVPTRHSGSIRLRPSPRRSVRGNRLKSSILGAINGEFTITLVRPPVTKTAISTVAEG